MCARRWRCDGEDGEVVGVAAASCDLGPNIADSRADRGLRWPGDEYRLGMACGKGASTCGCACLQQERRALRRWLRQMDRIELKVFALMVDTVDLRRVGEYATGAIPYHRAHPAKTLSKVGKQCRGIHRHGHSARREAQPCPVRPPATRFRVNPVTTFQPIRPLVRWSSEDKRRASTAGISWDVLAVTARPR